MKNGLQHHKSNQRVGKKRKKKNKKTSNTTWLGCGPLASAWGLHNYWAVGQFAGVNSEPAASWLGVLLWCPLPPHRRAPHLMASSTSPAAAATARYCPVCAAIENYWFERFPCARVYLHPWLWLGFCGYASVRADHLFTNLSVVWRVGWKRASPSQGLVRLIPSARGLRGILTCWGFNLSQHPLIPFNSLATEQNLIG